MQTAEETEEGFASQVTDDGSVVSAIARGELDQQITTAKRYPRSLKAFLDESKTMATVSTDVAMSCLYALKRGNKMIEGPSVRLAEIVLHAWTNARGAARVVEVGETMLTAQGLCHDVERNVAILYEVRRRITDRAGKRFNDDMIAVTANAACSIALRNAVFRNVPRSFWQPAYQAARELAAGKGKSIAVRRAECMEFLGKLGATPEAVLGLFGYTTVEELTGDNLLQLRGIAQRILDEEVTVDDAFAPDAPPAGEAAKMTAAARPVNAATAVPRTGKAAPPAKATEPKPEPAAAPQAAPAAEAQAPAKAPAPAAEPPAPAQVRTEPSPGANAGQPTTERTEAFNAIRQCWKRLGWDSSEGMAECGIVVGRKIQALPMLVGDETERVLEHMRQLVAEAEAAKGAEQP